MSAPPREEASVVGKLSTLDRFLPVWILAAMAVGLLAGRLVPGLGEALGAVAVDGVSHHAGDQVRVRSAGSAPADEINPAVRAVMAELGIDLAHEVPTELSHADVDAADVVITMGCGDACPVFPGRRYLDWELTDPAGRDVDEVRAIRDDIDRRVRALLVELTATV